MEEEIILGYDLLAEVHVKNEKLLSNLKNVTQKVAEILKNRNIKDIGKLSYEFNNKGFTLVFGLMESHLSLHTWPENGLIAIDIFSCNKEAKILTKQVFDDLCEYFQVDDGEYHLVKRVYKR